MPTGNGIKTLQETMAEYYAAAPATTGTTGQCGYTDPNTPTVLNETDAINDPRGTMADMTRNMSLDFFNTAVPVKDELIQMTTYNGNSGVVDGLKTQGAAQVKAAFDGAGEVAGRNTARYGMDLTKEQKSAQDTALTSGRALAEVDSDNRATMFQQDLNKQLVSGIAGTSGVSK